MTFFQGKRTDVAIKFIELLKSKLQMALISLEGEFSRNARQPKNFVLVTFRTSISPKKQN